MRSIRLAINQIYCSNSSAAGSPSTSTDLSRAYCFCQYTLPALVHDRPHHTSGIFIEHAHKCDPTSICHKSTSDSSVVFPSRSFSSSRLTVLPDPRQLHHRHSFTIRVRDRGKWRQQVLRLNKETHLCCWAPGVGCGKRKGHFVDGSSTVYALWEAENYRIAEELGVGYEDNGDENCEEKKLVHFELSE